MKNKFIILMLLACGLSSLLPAYEIPPPPEDFEVAGGWKASIDAGIAPSYFRTSDSKAKSDAYTKLLLNSGWTTAKSSFTNTPGLFNGGISIGYDFGPHLDERGWSCLTGVGYRYYAGPESLITANANASNGYLSGTEDTTMDVGAFYIFAQPTFHLNAHHAIFARVEGGLSVMDFQDNLSFYNSVKNPPSFSLDETASGTGYHGLVMLGYQFTPWRHFAFNVSAGLHEEVVNKTTLLTVKTNNLTTTDKAGDTVLGSDGYPLTEDFFGGQANISASFIW